MNVLLLSMPDSFEHMPTLGIRIPNGALASLAGNLERGHSVAAADLLLADKEVAATVKRLMSEFAPQLVGLSIMTFQRRTAKKIIRLIRSLSGNVQVVVGGYDPSLAIEAYAGNAPDDADFIVRGEGEITLRQLVEAIQAGAGFGRILGLSYRNGTNFSHNPDRPPSRLDDGAIWPPNRAARVLKGYTLLGRQIDVVETSRGCTFDCSFCSIIEMRGRNFHTFSMERVLADIDDARSRGARAIFIVDDNITLNVRRFEMLCEAIIKAGLNKLEYMVQATAAAVANHAATLPALMRRAGFRYVFLGIENVLTKDLEFLKARSKNEARENGHPAGSAAVRAIECLHRNNMLVVGGLIVGNPGDSRDSVLANLEFARRYVDWPYIQHPTPYPRTPMAQEFHRRGLITNDRLEEYDGTTAVVRSEHLAAEEIEFLRWRAERWMKVRHIPAVFLHAPGFVLRNWHKMLAHTFRGSSWKSLVHLEDERKAFTRYRALRSAERNYL